MHVESRISSQKSLSNLGSSIITTADDVDEKNNSFQIDELIRGIASLSLESKAEKTEKTIQSDAAIKKARRSVRRSLDPLCSYVGLIDEVRTGIPGLEEASINALLASGLEELPIHKEIEEVRDGFRRNFGVTTRTISDQPCHLSRAESLDKFRALPQEIEMSAEKKRAQMVDWIFRLTARIKKLECVSSLSDMAYFSAVYILDCSLMKHAKRIYKLSDKANRPVLIAAVKLAATKEMGSVNEKATITSALRSVIDESGCRDKDIKDWYHEHEKTLDSSTNSPTHMRSTHLVQELRKRWSMIDSIMKPDQYQSGWLMIENLAAFAVSKARLKRHNSLLLASAIIWIALEFFASRRQLDEPLNSEIYKRLLGEKSEHVPVALELLDWILSDEMILPSLTEKIKDAKSELQKIKERSRHMWMSHS